MAQLPAQLVQELRAQRRPVPEPEREIPEAPPRAGAPGRYGRLLAAARAEEARVVVAPDPGLGGGQPVALGIVQDLAAMRAGRPGRLEVAQIGGMGHAADQDLEVRVDRR